MKKKLLLVAAVVAAVALFAGAFVLYNQLKDTVQLSTLGETTDILLLPSRRPRPPILR